MVNADIVNADSSYFPPATFCESFLVLGRIPRFQNPFKYARGFNINQRKAMQADLAATFIAQYQRLTKTARPLTIPQSTSAKLVQHRKAPAKGQRSRQES